jgi:ATP phosphoribosyltransferase
MLRIAVPNKGSLSGPAADMLHEAGYQQRRESKELRIVDPENEVEFFYLRPRDIAIYVSSGRLDIGITGRDLLVDSGARAPTRRRSCRSASPAPPSATPPSPARRTASRT